MLSDSVIRILAGVIVAAVCATPVVCYLIAWRRSSYAAAQYPFYLIHLFMSVFVWRTRVNRRLSIAPGQGAVIVGNHRSSIDPSFIHVASDRLVHWMIASEYWKPKFLNWFFRLAQCIPVNRGGIDTAATKMAIRYAQQGDLVGMFPEGRINLTKELLLPGRPGAALVALKARVPVIPCYIADAPYDGTMVGCFLMPAKVKVTFGDPIDLSPYYDRDRDEALLQELTKRFLKEIATLAGHPEFEPQLAGKRWKPPDASNGAAL